MYGSNPTPSFASRRRPLLVAGGLVLAVILALLPPNLADMARMPITTALAPAQRGLAAVRRVGNNARTRVLAQFTSAETTANRELENQRLLQENRRLKADLQAVRDQLRMLAHRDSPGPSLLAAECIPVRILGAPAQAYLVRHHLLDAGRVRGVETDALVLRLASPLIDRGVHAGVEEGNVVLAGSCVWGKIASTGPHTSTVRPMTEPGYRDLVRLAAMSPDGQTLRFGSKGILEGTGESLARLRMIETTEPVAEGDLVYSMAGQGFVDVPLLCGRVVRVERPHGAGYWDIWVAPASDETPDDLAVLCPKAHAIELARLQAESEATPGSE